MQQPSTKRARESVATGHNLVKKRCLEQYPPYTRRSCLFTRGEDSQYQVSSVKRDCGGSLPCLNTFRHDAGTHHGAQGEHTLFPFQGNAPIPDNKEVYKKWLLDPSYTSSETTSTYVASASSDDPQLQSSTCFHLSNSQRKRPCPHPTLNSVDEVCGERKKHHSELPYENGVIHTLDHFALQPYDERIVTQMPVDPCDNHSRASFSSKLPTLEESQSSLRDIDFETVNVDNLMPLCCLPPEGNAQVQLSNEPPVEIGVPVADEEDTSTTCPQLTLYKALDPLYPLLPTAISSITLCGSPLERVTASLMPWISHTCLPSVEPPKNSENNKYSIVPYVPVSQLRPHPSLITYATQDS